MPGDTAAYQFARLAACRECQVRSLLIPGEILALRPSYDTLGLVSAVRLGGEGDVQEQSRRWPQVPRSEGPWVFSRVRQYGRLRAT